MIKVEIWSDIGCPWCYIGRRRFEKALSQFEHRDQVEITWRSYELDPGAPREFPGSIHEILMKKMGAGRAQVETMHARVAALAAQEGLDYHFETVRPANTFDAHRLIHLAGRHSLQSEMKERLQRAYFTEGRVISDPKTLVELATEVGLDENEVLGALVSQSGAADVLADERRAQSLGITGVPFFLFDEKYAVSGAQPVHLFLSALEHTWQESHPVQNESVW